jgi:hypothetical protein
VGLGSGESLSMVADESEDPAAVISDSRVLVETAAAVKG